MNLKVSELRAFQKMASPLKGHNILPILEYIKLEDGKATKSVLTSFVQFECSGIDKPILVDEKLLGVKLSNPAADFLNITQKGNKVTITDTKIPTTFQVPELVNFPAIPEPTSERFPISENFMKVLGRAQYFPLKMDETNTSWMSFIMVGNGHICASNGIIFFSEPIDEEFELVLDNRHAQLISKLQIKEYAYSDNYMFFYTDNAVIGFSKQEIKYINVINYGKITSDKEEFNISASDMQQFNSECAQSSKIPFVTLQGGKMFMNDKDMDITLEQNIENLTPSAPFTYNAEHMNRLLTAIDAEDIHFFKGQNFYWIKTPGEKFTTLVMQLHPETKE